MINIFARILITLGSLATLLVSLFVFIFSFDPPSGPEQYGLLLSMLGFAISVWGIICGIAYDKAKSLVSDITKRPEILVNVSIYLILASYMALWIWFNKAEL